MLHFGFLAYVAVGGFIAWLWPRAIVPHIAAVGWSLGIVTVGYTCPLTTLERHLRSAANDAGFIDRYVEGVIYPEEYTSHLRLLVAVAVLVAYAGAIRAARQPSMS